MRERIARWVVCVTMLGSLGALAPSVRDTAFALVLMDQRVEVEGVTLRVQLERDDNWDGKESDPVSRTDRPIRLTVEAKRAPDGTPLTQWWPGAWIDWQIDPLSGSVPTCSQRIGRYLGGSLLARPLVDLTGSYVVTMDQEPSLSVLDPSVNFAGRSSLYRSVSLPAPAADWVATPDDRWLVLAVPSTKAVIVVETGDFTIAHRIDRPRHPRQLFMQPQSRLIWISELEDRAGGKGQGWLTAIDTATWSVVESFSVREGLPLVTFAAEGGWVYVANRSARQLTIIDSRRMVVHRTLSLDFSPTGLAATPSEPMLWVVDGKKGRVVRFDVDGHERDRLAVAPTLEWASLSPDGRWVVVATPPTGLTAIATTSPHRMVSIPLSGKPRDLLWSDQFAYVLVPEQGTLSLFTWPSLGEGAVPVKSIAIGASALSVRAGGPTASTMTLMADGKGTFIAHPTERTIYTYMEGMNAPTQGVRAYGHTPLAVKTVRRTLQEIEPGVYHQWVRLPASSGRLMLAIAGESPLVRTCVGLPPLGQETPRQASQGWQWEALPKLTAHVAEPVTVQLSRLSRESAGEERDDGSAAHVTLRLMRARGGLYDEWPLRRLPDSPNAYEATGTVREAGTYFLYPTVNGRPASVPGTLIVEE
ncbi:MAG: hypothetical protein NNA31_07820 [Nitrospira sp.]|nr:hypothetical protein [Nitrospira sp.]